MSRNRRYPWDLREVPWSDLPQFTRGTQDGTVLLSWGIGPRDKLATRRQLRAMGLRPGGQDPAALLYFRHRPSCRQVLAELFLIEHAKPVRPMTPAKRAALDRAMAARRTCRQCGDDAGVELPRNGRVCEPCRYTLGLAPDDYLHDYLTGTPIDPCHDGRDTELAPVVPITPATTTGAGWKEVAA
ncbi:MAG: hypothetical protein GEU86_12910 [Actinophytocola sp.]|nr:hypothetical protein [Actinophytocola sp.]